MLKDLLLKEGEETAFGKQLSDILTGYVFPFLAVGAVLWCLWFGIMFAKAKDAGARDNAKKRLIKGLASVMIIIVLFFILRGLSARIDERDAEKNRNDDNTQSGAKNFQPFDNQNILGDNNTWKIKM